MELYFLNSRVNGWAALTGIPNVETANHLSVYFLSRADYVDFFCLLSRGIRKGVQMSVIEKNALHVPFELADISHATYSTGPVIYAERDIA